MDTVLYEVLRCAKIAKDSGHCRFNDRHSILYATPENKHIYCAKISEALKASREANATAASNNLYELLQKIQLILPASMVLIDGIENKVTVLGVTLVPAYIALNNISTYSSSFFEIMNSSDAKSEHEWLLEAEKVMQKCEQSVDGVTDIHPCFMLTKSNREKRYILRDESPKYKENDMDIDTPEWLVETLKRKTGAYII